MFGTKHIILLVLCAAYITAALLFLCRKRVRVMTALRCLALIGLVSETLKMFTYIVINEEEYGGYLPKTDLPFHLCSLQLFFMVIILLTKNEKIKRIVYSFMMPSCMIGGIAAMLLPTSSSLSVPMITVQYFLYHSSIVIFALYLALTKEIRFTVRDYASSLLVLWALLFISVYLNSWVNDYSHPINFMYVVNPPVDGLPFLNKDKGWLSYILRYAATAVVCITLCYTKPIVTAIRDRLSRKAGTAAE